MSLRPSQARVSSAMAALCQCCHKPADGVPFLSCGAKHCPCPEVQLLGRCNRLPTENLSVAHCRICRDGPTNVPRRGTVESRLSRPPKLPLLREYHQSAERIGS